MSTGSTERSRSDLERAMDRATYEAETPNGTISARSNPGENWYDVTFTFHNGQARRAGDAKIEQDIARLGRLVFAQGMAQWRRAQRAANVDGPVEMNERRRAWMQERDAMSAEGRSADGSIRVTCVGMAHWSAELARGTTERLDDRALGVALTQAGRELTDAWVTQLRALNREHFFGRRG